MTEDQRASCLAGVSLIRAWLDDCDDRGTGDQDAMADLVGQMLKLSGVENVYDGLAALISGVVNVAGMLTVVIELDTGVGADDLISSCADGKSN